MKNLRYMLIAVYSAFLLLPLGSCMDTDMNRNKYEVDSEEIGRENYDLGSTIRGLQGLVIPAQEHSLPIHGSHVWWFLCRIFR